MLIRRLLEATVGRPAASAGAEALVLRFDGARYACPDWTPGGVRLRTADAAAAPDRRVEGEIEGFGLRGPFEAHVSHVDGGCAFLRFDSVPAPLFLEMMRVRGA